MILIWQSDQEEDMINYEADPRRAEIIISELGLHNSKFLFTFIVKDDKFKE